jgi:signal transduction histidine kinase
VVVEQEDSQRHVSILPYTALSMTSFAGPRSLRQLLDAVMAVGSDLDLPAMLRRIVQSAMDLSDARYGALGVLDESRTRLAQFITIGIDDETHKAIGHLPTGHGILGLLVVEAKPIRLPDLHEHPDSQGFPPNHPPMKSFLGVPIRVRDQVFGNLYLTDKTSAEVFTDVDEELVVALASAAGVAIENARLHTRVQELALVEDRERIARDLHDTVIQRLFATGLSLQGSLRLVGGQPELARDRVQTAVDDLDVTVKYIRSAIFGLEATRPVAFGPRTRVLELVGEAAGSLGFEPRVMIDGPVDAGVSDEVAADLLAVLREALSNVARHAQATKVDVELVVDDASICLRVVDDGVGPPPEGAPRGSGLSNIAARAERYGGTTTLTAATEGSGTVVEWKIPRR